MPRSATMTQTLTLRRNRQSKVNQQHQMPAETVKIQTLKLKRQYRSVAIQSGDIDVESRTVSLSFSSETPCERGWDGKCIEILGHNVGEVDLSRLNNKAPFLKDHDSSQQPGVVDHAELSGGKGRAVVRFSRRP